MAATAKIGQSADTPRPIGKGEDIGGQRFGKLTALHVVDKQERGNRWLCACDCGGFAIRQASALKYASREGSIPQCRACLSGLQSSQALGNRKLRSQRFKAMFQKFGRLWSIDSTDRLCAEVARELETAGHEAPPTDLAF